MAKIGVLAGIMLAAVMAAATAQEPVSPQATISELTRESMTALLDAGWTVAGFTGSDGEFFLLVKEGKWIRCELVGERRERLPRALSLVDATFSICRRLN